jgi:hypothetical protein
VGDLGETVDEESDLVAEIRLYRVEIDKGVLDNIVEQSGRNAYFVKPQIGEDISDFERMDQVRFTRGSLLASMMESREKVCPAYQINVCARPVSFYFLDDVFDADHQYADSILQSKRPVLPFFSSGWLTGYF